MLKEILVKNKIIKKITNIEKCQGHLPSDDDCSVSDSELVFESDPSLNLERDFITGLFKINYGSKSCPEKLRE